MKDEAQAQHEKLVELVAEGNDALLEEFFEKGTIPEEDLIPALHNAIREDKIFPVIFGSGLGNIGADRVMDFIVDYTPAPSEHEWVQGDPASSSNGEPPAAPRNRFRAGVALRVQNGFRSLRGTHFIFQSLFRRPEERCHAAEFQPQLPGEVRAHFHHAGQDRGAGDGAARRRHRRGGQTERHAHRRHAGRQVSADPVSASEAAGAGHHLRHRTQEPR